MGVLGAMPKVELHLHLEGCVDAELVRALAARHGADADVPPALRQGDYPGHYPDGDGFFATLRSVMALVRTPDDLTEVAAALARRQAREHVLLTEVTVDVLALVDAGLEPGPMWRALRDGLAEAADIRIGLVVAAIRDAGPGAADRLVRLVEAAEAPVVGLGLVGSEDAVATRDFRPLREAADRLHLGLVVHAGETGGPGQVRAALDDLGADRIAHGIAAAQDETLLTRLVRDRVPLDVCPTSNVALGLVPDLEHHPVPRLLEAGAHVTVSSDDPPVLRTTLTQELEHVMRLAALTRRDVADLQRRAVQAAFTTPQVRQDLLARVDAWAAASTL